MSPTISGWSGQLMRYLTLMANGETKPISEVAVGDEVLATDPETGESGPREIMATLPHTDQLLTLRLSSGDWEWGSPREPESVVL